MVIIRTNVNDQFNNVRDYFTKIENEIGTDLLNHDETVNLFIEYREKGNLEARVQLIKMNLRLVNKYAIEMMTTKNNLEDLIQEGNIGLIKAIEKFDYTSDTKFSSYAVKSIRQNIKRYICSDKTIRMPEDIVVAVARVEQLENKLNRPITYDEAKKVIGMDKINTQTVLDISKKTVISYEYTQIEEGEPLINNIEDTNIKDFSNYLILKERNDKLYNILTEILEERELFVIVNRFGLNGEEPKTLQVISDIIGRTRELVRRIEIKSIEKIRTFLKDNNIVYSDLIIEETY